jgi:hypothetical protein
MSTFLKSFPLAGSSKGNTTTACILPPIAVAGGNNTFGSASNLTTGAWIDPKMLAARRVLLVAMVGADGGNFAEADFWIAQGTNTAGAGAAALDTTAHLAITAASTVAMAEVDLAATTTAVDSTTPKYIGLMAKVKNSSGTASTPIAACLFLLDPMQQSPNWPA